MTLLHEYYHAMDMLTYGCNGTLDAGEGGLEGVGSAEERALDEYERIFGRIGPGADGYDADTHGTAPPPCE